MDLLLKTINGILSLNILSSHSLAIGLFCLLGLLLGFSRSFKPALNLEMVGIPIALIVGVLVLAIGPYGQFPLLPESVTETWIQFPAPLLTLVFATLMLGRPIPRGRGVWKPIASQSLVGLMLGFGQYLVGGLAVLLILIPYLGVDPLMGCLIEVGFEGGHGAAAIMGKSFSRLGFPEGLDLGLAMATVGLLSSTVLGSGLVVLGRWRGWIAIQSSEEIKNATPLADSNSFIERFREAAVNLAFVGLAVLFGVGLLYGLRLLAPFLGDLFQEVLLVFPVFPLALLGSLFIRYLLEITGNTDLISALLMRGIGILATDLLITTATASVNLPLLINDWVPLTILAVTGLTWNLAGMFVVARLTFQEEWFERSIAEFGNATGVAASGVLLLRLADPNNVTSTLPIFSTTRLFLQPLLSGGLVTVIAPIAVVKLGLLGWTEVCGLLTMVSIFLAFFMQGSFSEEVN
ncbi:sodium:solute symporter [Prochlorococcus sp. MIT 1307]|uniref:sodium/glutamate symporter n=1 Tax=Prochlorococcus sp. MIT 1307 TaxID=3096219 RepID=UPI002A760F19|nr:sodium:solute symporter [Prochlorococcus sp. MIT 1307]